MSLFAVVIVATATACSDDAGAPAPAPVDRAAVTGEPAGGPVAEPTPDVARADDTLPSAMGQDLPAFTTAASGAEVTSTAPDAPILRAVRIGAHEGFDRIVFEFHSTGLPQWHVSYIDAPVIQCGSGHETPLAGAAWLQVRFSGARAHTDAGEATSGPARRTVDLSSVREVVRTCDFEAEVTWVVGVAGVQPYRPRVLEDPARLVLDIAH